MIEIILESILSLWDEVYVQVMREFRTGSSRVLITTDLLARGIGKSDLFQRPFWGLKMRNDPFI